MNKSDFEIYLAEVEVDRQIQRINVFKTKRPEYNILISSGEINILTDLNYGRTRTGIDVILDRKTQADWDLFLIVINYLLLRFDIDPLNLALRKECSFSLEKVLHDINRSLLPDPFEEFDELAEAELMEELKKTEENLY